MKKIENLIPSNFPDVDPIKFEEWKNMHIEAKKKSFYFRIGYTVFLLILLFVLLGNKIYLGVIPLLILFGVRFLIEKSIMNPSEEHRREIGISDEVFKKSLQ